MGTLRAWLLRLGEFFNRTRCESDLTEEIEANLQLHIDDNMRSGMTREEARRVARLKIGSIEATKEAVRDRRGIRYLETLTRDVQYAFRMLRKNKGWSAIAILSLTLGIGVNTVLFSIANNVLLQKLPVPDPDKLVAFRWAGENDMTDSLLQYGYTRPDVQSQRPGGRYNGATFSFGVFRQFQNEARDLADVFAFAPLFTLNVVANGQAEFATGQYVSGAFYSALGVSPIQGRLINSGDDDPAADPVAVISYPYWQRRFGMDTSVIGRKVTINRLSFTIVGITPETLGSTMRSGDEPRDISLPLALEPSLGQLTGTVPRLSRPAFWWVVVMARLKPGVSAQQVEAKLESFFEPTVREEWNRALSAMNPERRALPEVSQANKVPRLKIGSGSKGAYDATPNQSGPLAILGVLAGIVLLLVCTNLASLLLSRAAARQREIAVRTSVGATRSRLIGQMLTESLVIAGFGGGFGLWVAYWCRTFLPKWLGFRPVDMNLRVMSFAFVLTFTTGILFGLVPALRTSRVDLAACIRENGPQLTSGRLRLSKSLLVVQVALSLVLLIGAGLFLRTLNNLRHIDVGFNPSNIVVFGIIPALNQYDDARTEALYTQILDRLAAVPGVRSATSSSLPILSGMSNQATFSLDGRPEHAETYALEVHQNYFDTMGISLELGRRFTPQDNPAGTPVVIINQAFAKRLFPNENPIGHRLQQTFAGAPVAEIVGVVTDAKYNDLRATAPPTFYIHDLQRPSGGKTFEVRTVGDATALIPAIRETMSRIDPLLPLRWVSTQSDNIESSISQERVFALTTSLFSTLALVIATIGLFGVMSYAVVRRTKEIGIRMAIGAESGQVLRSLLCETLTVVAIGIVIGLGVALASTRLIAARLYGLAPHDVLTIAIAIVIMLAVAALAAYLPARRASRIDPLTALRHE